MQRRGASMLRHAGGAVVTRPTAKIQRATVHQSGSSTRTSTAAPP